LILNKPRGKLIAIGGAINTRIEENLEHPEQEESDELEPGILSRILSETGKENPRIEVVTTASEIPEEVGEHYLEAFDRLGHSNVGLIHIKTREDALKEEFSERAKMADGFLFTGGNQLRLTTIFGGTSFIQIILNKYLTEELVVAGTSAGAMAMSHTMIMGSSSKALLKNEVKLARGFGFIKDVTFDSHFVKRGRFSRLFQAVATNPGCLGIGLGEDTGLLITEGNQMEAIGSGLVIIVDGTNIRSTNIASIPDNEPISIENLNVHILVKGNGYQLNERRFVANFSESSLPQAETAGNK